MTPPPQVQVPEEVLDEQKKEKSAQYKLNKIVKAAKKEDHLSTGIPRLGSQGDEERRQGEYRRLACSSERTRSGKGSSDGSRKSSHATLVAVAYLFATIGGEVERIHCAIPIVRDVLPYSNARCHSLPQASPTQSGSSKEEGRTGWAWTRRTFYRSPTTTWTSPTPRRRKSYHETSTLRRYKKDYTRWSPVLSDLSESAEKLEPKAKRPRTKKKRISLESKYSSLQPFGKADAS